MFTLNFLFNFSSLLHLFLTLTFFLYFLPSVPFILKLGEDIQHPESFDEECGERELESALRAAQELKKSPHG